MRHREQRTVEGLIGALITLAALSAPLRPAIPIELVLARHPRREREQSSTHLLNPAPESDE
jgi:hypothetical protein